MSLPALPVLAASLKAAHEILVITAATIERLARLSRGEMTPEEVRAHEKASLAAIEEMHKRIDDEIDAYEREWKERHARDDAKGGEE